MYAEPTLLLVKHVSGEEEVPEGVVGVLSGAAPDVLSHLAVRSRNMRVLLAACWDEAPLEELAGLQGESAGGRRARVASVPRRVHWSS